ncbi:MAG: hypothetical protein AUG49_16350 [Catenulispora sp. 13_1_20CM_3_70_7]|nr:MAG: hypothetical protein AUG49_16350 [Catenulispora sp. 13_1_20CM_3_70_7]
MNGDLMRRGVHLLDEHPRTRKEKRELSRRLATQRAETAAAQAEAQAEAARAAARIEAGHFVAEVGMRHIGMAADTEERLLRRHPYQRQAARLEAVVDALSALAADEITLLALHSRRASGR